VEVGVQVEVVEVGLGLGRGRGGSIRGRGWGFWAFWMSDVSAGLFFPFLGSSNQTHSEPTPQVEAGVRKGGGWVGG
jgi:hypothetical protein